MKPTTLFAPALLVAGLSSTSAFAHPDVAVAVGLPPVVVTAGGVQVVIGPHAEPAPPPVVVVHEPAPPPRVVYVHEAPASSAVVYPRHRYPAPHEVVVVDGGSCDHPGKHWGHHKHHDKHHDKHGGKHHGDGDDNRGMWR
ncbi:MAG: hypothetical protein HYS27_20670 [Deltaproteobacteria bacterium]|nr:hypothetical protein [Deltaproteobacteria bacterium]